jgi:hypothetical protein
MVDRRTGLEKADASVGYGKVGVIDAIERKVPKDYLPPATIRDLAWRLCRT